MPITTEVDPETGIRRHRVTGALSLSELEASLRLIYERPDFDPDANVYWDLREARFSHFSPEEVRRVADLVTRRWGKPGKSRAALVVSRDAEFGMARMYEMLLDGRSTGEVAVFRDPEEALDWLS